MEQDLNQIVKKEEENLNYFKPQHKYQKVKDTPEFKKWYKKANKYINEENKKRTLKCKTNYNMNDNYDILLISFCNNCSSYVICSYNYGYSFVNCRICKSSFCCGCLRNRLYNGDCSTCLKGFVKMIYLRLINERVQINEVKFYYYIIHFIFFVFFYTYISIFFNFLYRK